MRHTAKVNGFSDIDEHSWLLPPNVIVPAADVAALRIYKGAELFDGSMVRRVWYESGASLTPTRYYYEMTPYIHPAGAGSFTLGTNATAADGVVTHTPGQEGRLLGEDGALINTSSAAIDIAGALLTDYYYNFNDNLNQREHFRALTIEEGDFLWLVRKASSFELDASGNITSGRIVIVSSTVAGEIEDGVDLDTSSVANYDTSLRKNLLRDAAPRYALGVGKALAARVGAGLVAVELDLGVRLRR